MNEKFSLLHSSRILLTGAHGFLGQHVSKKLNTISPTLLRTPSSSEYDLREKNDCAKAVKNIDIVIHLAGVVGGIGFNQKIPGQIFFDNLIMGIQLMDEARKAGVKKFVSIGSVCAYPKFTHVPFKEDDIWMGYPEETNAPFGLAKKMLLVQSQAYRKQYGFNAIYLLPVNLYGPGDHFDLETSHVVPALIRKFIDAKDKKHPQVTVWGSGKATREFLFAQDAADAIVLASEKYDKPNPVNIGTGSETSIQVLATTIAKIVGYKGKIIWDTSKPDGQPRRRVDTTRAKKEFGFRAKTNLLIGLKRTIDWYTKNF